MKILLLIIVSVTLIAGCSSHSRHKYEEGVDSRGEEKKFTGTNIELFSKKPEGQLDYARTLVAEGQYQKATEVYLNVYSNSKADSTVREEALYQVGYLYRNALNPYHRAKTAIHYFEKLLAEFPTGKHRKDAEDMIVTLKTFLPADEKN